MWYEALLRTPWLSAAAPVILLIISNVFMTYAWYGHLKDLRSAPIWLAVMASWGVAFFEYCFQVPGNRIGFQAGRYSLVELKTMQEVITLVVFAVFAMLYMNQKLAWNHLAAFVLLVGAVVLVFGKW